MSGTLGLVVGSGLPALGLDVVARSQSHTPYGPPSSALLTVEIGGRRVLCVARHGEEHSIAPHEVNYRANLWALYQHGVRRCVAVNVVGTIARDFHPGDVAVPEQLIDYTWGRESTYGSAERGVVHAEFAQPIDVDLAARIAAAAEACGQRVVRGGVYGVTQGPRLETIAEIERLARDGCTMVGMTAMPEAVLARELGMNYAICALGINYAAGRDPSGAPIHDQIERNLSEGMRRIAAVLARLVADLS
ncbi:MAG TPA: S-methyl-5'-thioinosine phosphorylase [Gammaproteobacteria bacterium]